MWQQRGDGDTPQRPGTTGPAPSSRELLAASQKAHTGDHAHYLSQGQAGRGRVVPCSQLTASPTSLLAHAPGHTKGYWSKLWRQLQSKHRQARREGTAALAILLEGKLRAGEHQKDSEMLSLRSTCKVPEQGLASRT